MTPGEWMGRLGNSSAAVILSLAIVLFAGFFVTRITKKLHLPNVTGYILAGVLIGPYALKLIPDGMIEGMDFVTDIALAFLAFSVGKYFKLSRLRKNGARVVAITMFESLIAAAAVSLAMIFVFRLPVPFSLLLGAIGSATAPASTIMTIRQYKAKGEFVNTILEVVALDDAVALTAFSVCAAVVGALDGGGVQASDIYLPLLYNGAAILAGAVCGVLLKWIISDRRSQEHRLVLINAVILAVTGACSLLGVSPLLACMVMGAVYVNIIKDKALFKQVNHFTPPVMLMFFVLSGMKLNVPLLAAAGVIGVGYFLVRIAGKYAGAWLGARVSGAPLEIRRWLGLALIPQAGVSIGLAALGQRMLPPEAGALLSTIILSSGILYEMVGPACAKASLFLSHSIRQTSPAAGPAAPPVQGRLARVRPASAGEAPSLPPPPKEAKEGKGKRKGKRKEGKAKESKEGKEGRKKEKLRVS